MEASSQSPLPGTPDSGTSARAATPAGSDSSHQTVRGLVRELLVELACVAAVYFPIVLIARATILYLHIQGERAAAVPLESFFSLASLTYYIEDIQSFFWLAGLCLSLGLLISRRIFLRQALIGGLLFTAIVTYVAGVNYYATYEVQFGWNHILKWEGTGEMLTSIRAETPWLAIYAVLAGILVIMAWVVWSARLLTRLRTLTLTGDSNTPGDYDSLPVWPGGIRLMMLSLVLVPAPWAGLHYMAGASDHARAIEQMNFEEAYRFEIQQTLGTNVLNQLLFTLGRTKSDRYDLITPDGKRFVSKRPFRFRFETDSLEWSAKHGGVGKTSPDSGNAGIAPAALIAPINFPARGKKYNVVLYFFESTAAKYLEETIAAYPEIPPRTIEEMLAEAAGEAATTGVNGAISDQPEEISTVRQSDGPDHTPETTDAIESALDTKEDAPEPEELPVTPVWEQLAENSLVALQHYVQAPLSINSLFSILTSAYALPADRWAATDYPDIPLVSLPEILKQNGYRTGVFHTGTYHYAGQGNFLKHRMFDVMQDAKQLRVPPFTEEINWGIDDRALIEPSVKFARASRNQGKPFFLVTMPVSPHHPYEVPEPAFELYDVDPETDSFPDRWKRAYAKYKNALYYSDYVLGQYIKAFEEAGLAENTIFIVFADHGEAFGQHRGNYNHPFFVYEENVHVPFLIYNKQLFPQTIEYKHISRHTDILPTVLDMVGLSSTIEARHEGRSLLAGGPPQIATFYTSWRNRLAGLRDDRYKYIYNLETGREELYDLQKDPREYRDIEDAGLKDRYRNYIFELTVYQRKYFEKVLNRPIDWSATQEKDEGPVVREKDPAKSGQSGEPESPDGE